MRPLTAGLCLVLLHQVPVVMHAQDSIAVLRGPLIDAATDTVTMKQPGHKSTTLAVVLSAVCPGAGQVYNESYWKAPIVVGLGLYYASEWLTNNRRYRSAADQFSASITASTPQGDGDLLRLREFYKDERDTFSWYFLILYLLNILDAYVDASLYGFDVSGNLTAGPPPGGPPTVSLQLQLRFP